VFYRQILLMKSRRNSVKKFRPEFHGDCSPYKIYTLQERRKIPRVWNEKLAEVCQSPEEALDVTGSTLNAKLS